MTHARPRRLVVLLGVIALAAASALVVILRSTSTADAASTVNVRLSDFKVKATPSSTAHGRVYVSYGTRDTTVQGGRFVQQKVSVSTDGGARFRAPVALGPRSDLAFAAEAGGKFPGDYIGSAVRAGRVYLVWCRSSTPPDPTARFHQTLWAAVLAG